MCYQCVVLQWQAVMKCICCGITEPFHRQVFVNSSKISVRLTWSTHQNRLHAVSVIQPERYGRTSSDHSYYGVGLAGHIRIQWKQITHSSSHIGLSNTKTRHLLTLTSPKVSDLWPDNSIRTLCLKLSVYGTFVNRKRDYF